MRYPGASIKKDKGHSMILIMNLIFIFFQSLFSNASESPCLYRFTLAKGEASLFEQGDEKSKVLRAIPANTVVCVQKGAPGAFQKVSRESTDKTLKVSGWVQEKSIRRVEDLNFEELLTLAQKTESNKFWAKALEEINNFGTTERNISKLELAQKSIRMLSSKFYNKKDAKKSGCVFMSNIDDAIASIYEQPDLKSKKIGVTESDAHDICASNEIKNSFQKITQGWRDSNGKRKVGWVPTKYLIDSNLVFNKSLASLKNENIKDAVKVAFQSFYSSIEADAYNNDEDLFSFALLRTEQGAVSAAIAKYSFLERELKEGNGGPYPPRETKMIKAIVDGNLANLLGKESTAKIEAYLDKRSCPPLKKNRGFIYSSVDKKSFLVTLECHGDSYQNDKDIYNFWTIIYFVNNNDTYVLSGFTDGMMYESGIIYSASFKKNSNPLDLTIYVKGTTCENETNDSNTNCDGTEQIKVNSDMFKKL